MLDVNANLIPKEFADKGWRKATVLIVFVLAVVAIDIFAFCKFGETAIQYVFYSLGGLTAIIAAYFKINIKDYDKYREWFEKNVLPMINSKRDSVNSKPQSPCGDSYEDGEKTKSKKKKK